MNLSLRQLRAFLAIARLQSFTRAAEQLHISQAGLSSMLQDAEQQLGCRLFDRTTRSVSLTEQGRAFLPVATRVLNDLDGAQVSLGQLSEAASRTLAVGATPMVASSVMPAACAAFGAQWPQVAVTVHDLEREQIQARVQAGELDAGFGVFLEATSGVRRVRLQKMALQLAIGGPILREIRRARMRWVDLKQLGLLGLPPDNPIQQRIDSQLATIGRANEPRRAFNHLHTVLSMVEAGAGSAILPSFVAAASERYDVRLLPLTHPKIDVEFFEITRKGRPRGEMIAAFSACLLASMGVALAEAQ